MSTRILVRDDRGERTLTEGDLPLVIGAGVDASIRVPNPSDEDAHGDAFAYIGLDQDHLFVQAASPVAPVNRNGEAVLESCWLMQGDAITVGEAAILCERDGGTWRFTLAQTAPGVALAPPSEPPPRPAAASSTPIVVESAPPRRRGPSRSTSVALLAVLALLLLVLGFVFTAAPVSIQIEPSPHRLSIEGVLPSVELTGRRLMMPGIYRLSAEHPGYRALDTEIDIAWGSRPEFRFELRKLPGTVRLVTQPDAGARVRIDGESVGVTPLGPLTLEAGRHTLSVEADRHLPYEGSFEVEGLGREQSLAVSLTPAWATVSLRSEPGGATVRIDGEEAGVTPLDVELLEGRYQVEIAKEAHAPASAQLDVVANVDQVLPTFELEKARAVLELASRPAGATVTVAGAFRGATPLTLELSPGVAHSVRLSKPGHVSRTREVSLEPGEQRSLKVDLERELGVVFLTTQPADARLAVDGQAVGRATRRLELSTVAHRITITRPGYVPYETTITPSAARSRTLSVVLERESAGGPGKAAATAEGQALVRIEGGRFRMGASRRDQGRRANESLRQIELARAFLVSAREVSNGEFRRFRPSHSSGSVQGLSLDGDDRPVVMVSWEDAARYLNWLSEKDGLPPAYEVEGDTLVAVQPMTTGYRLPSEAEWAFIARYTGEGAPTKYPWGQRYPPRGRGLGNYADAAASAVLANVIPGYTDGHAVSAPVGSFKANALGFFDLGGNVAEWCHDFYGVYPASTRLERDPLGRARGTHHVVRGASWRHSSISELRLTYRDYSSKPRNDLGFRIARYAD